MNLWTTHKPESREQNPPLAVDPPARSGLGSFLHRNEWHFLIALLIALDIAANLLALRAAYWLRFELSLPIFELDVVPVLSAYERISVRMIPLWLVIYVLTGLYSKRNLLGGTREYSLVFRAAMASFLTVMLVSFFDPFFVVARGWLLSGWVLALALVIGSRFVVRRVAYRLRSLQFFTSRAIIVGVNSESQALEEQLDRWETSGIHVVGFLRSSASDAGASGVRKPVLGDYQELEQMVVRHNVQEIILASSAVSQEETLDVLRRYGFSEDVSVRISSGLYELLSTGIEVRESGAVSLFQVRQLRLRPIDRYMKSLLEASVMAPLLLLSLPIMAIVAILVRAESAGPIIHRRRVMGTNGRQFDAFKFRTMHVDGDNILDAHPELKRNLLNDSKLRDDPRVTKLGRVLRRTSIDELPQLINVIRREMSLIGPRMIAPDEMEKYADWGMNLLTVPPGITGLWQVSGRSDLSYEDRIKIDMFYIRNWSIWLDLQIISRTVPAVIKGSGAY